MTEDDCDIGRAAAFILYCFASSETSDIGKGEVQVQVSSLYTSICSACEGSFRVLT